MRIRERGEGGKEDDSEVGMKRREGGVIVSSRLGAAGRVFASVCISWLCLFVFAHFRQRHHASMLAGHTTI